MEVRPAQGRPICPTRRPGLLPGLRGQGWLDGRAVSRVSFYFWLVMAVCLIGIGAYIGTVGISMQLLRR